MASAYGLAVVGLLQQYHLAFHKTTSITLPRSQPANCFQLKYQLTALGNDASTLSSRKLVDYDDGMYIVSPKPEIPSINKIPKRYRRKLKRGQEEWSISEVIQQVLALKHWEDIDNVLNHWVGRFNRKNFPILIKEITKTGALQHSVRVFTWMKHQRIYRARNDIYNYIIRLHARHNRMDQARGFFNEMQKWRCKPDVETYDALMNAHGRAGQWRWAMNIFDAMLRAGVPPSRSSYNNLINAYGCNGRWEEALQICKKMTDNGVGPDLVTHNIVMSALKNGGQYGKAISYLEKMKQRKMQVDRISYNVIISCLTKLEKYDDAIQIFHKMRTSESIKCRPDVVTFNSVMHAYAACKRITHVKSTFESMLAESILPNIISYNILIGAYASVGMPQESLATFNLLKQNGFQPNVVSYTSLINAYGKSGQPLKAQEVFNLLEKNSCKPNSISYNALISAYGSVGNLTDSLRLFHEMEMYKIQPNSVTVCSLLTACSRSGYPEKVKDVLLKASEKHINLNITAYNAALAALVDGGLHDSAMDLYTLMEEEGIVPDGSTYSIMIRRAGLLGDLTEARQRFDKMHGLAGMTVEACSTLIDIYGKKGLHNEARNVFDSMKISGCTPNVVTFTSLIYAYGVADMPEEADLIFNEMLTSGVKVDVVAGTALMSAFNRSSQPDKALSFAKCLHNQEVPFNQITYLELFAACRKLRNWREALILFEEMQDVGISPFLAMMHHLIWLLGECGQVEKMMKVFYRFQELGVEPTLHTYNTLISSHLRAGKWRMCLEILGWFEASQFKPSCKTFQSVLAYLAHLELWEHYLNVCRKMMSHGYAPDNVVAKKILKALSGLGQHDKARELQSKLQVSRWESQEQVKMIVELSLS